ncbi:hypothetical protein FAGKG844_80030 [Frankia sp. AgKG'84/4]
MVRDEEWLVTAAEQAGESWRLDVVGIGELVRETTATFFSGLDHIELLDPREAKLLPTTRRGTVARVCGWKPPCAAPPCPSAMPH